MKNNWRLELVDKIKNMIERAKFLNEGQTKITVMSVLNESDKEYIVDHLKDYTTKVEWISYSKQSHVIKIKW